MVVRASTVFLSPSIPCTRERSSNLPASLSIDVHERGAVRRVLDLDFGERVRDLPRAQHSRRQSRGRAVWVDLHVLAEGELAQVNVGPADEHADPPARAGRFQGVTRATRERSAIRTSARPPANRTRIRNHSPIGSDGRPEPIAVVELPARYAVRDRRVLNGVRVAHLMRPDEERLAVPVVRRAPHDAVERPLRADGELKLDPAVDELDVCEAPPRSRGRRWLLACRTSRADAPPHPTPRRRTRRRATSRPSTHAAGAC